jgi:hypothetical protein
MAVPPGVSTFAEADYLYGAGPLTLLIEQVDRTHPVRYDGDAWLEVHGIQIDFRGEAIGHRSALIRARRLPTTGLPDWPLRVAGAPPAGSGGRTHQQPASRPTRDGEQRA